MKDVVYFLEKVIVRKRRGEEKVRVRKRMEGEGGRVRWRKGDV